MGKFMITKDRRKNLAPEEIEGIRRDLSQKKTYREISEKYGIAMSTLNNLVVAFNKGFEDLAELAHHYARSMKFRDYSCYQERP